MTTPEVLNMAVGDGVALKLVGGRLMWSADHQPSDELLAELKTRRPAIVQALRCQWLAGVAALLECSPAYLMERGFIDHDDLAEQCEMHPRYAARLIRSHPEWSRHHSQDIQIQSTTTCGFCPDNKKESGEKSVLRNCTDLTTELHCH
jgi:hypothetical protein